jgi:membrane-associated protein
LFQAWVPELTTLSPPAVLITIFVLSVLETSFVIGIVLPGEVLVAACIGVLQPSWSPWAGVVASAGCLAGQVLGYLLGRSLGRATLYGGWLGRKVGRERLAMAERIARDTGGWLVITARFVAVLHTLAPLLAGALRMPLRQFLCWAALSAVVWAALWTAVGAALGHAGRVLDQDLVTIGFVAVGALVATVVSARTLRGSAR